jgi:hypothetical protein
VHGAVAAFDCLTGCEHRLRLIGCFGLAHCDVSLRCSPVCSSAEAEVEADKQVQARRRNDWNVSMSEYWEETIQLLQPASGPQLVSKPTLKPDLLQKVPFKFLHDVITAVSAHDVSSCCRLLASHVNIMPERIGASRLCPCQRAVALKLAQLQAMEVHYLSRRQES